MMSNFQNKIIKNEKGVWRYANFYDEFIKPENRLSLGRDTSRCRLQAEGFNSAGDIPECRLRGIKRLYFKREDENATGSLKDRSLAYQVSLARQNGKKELVISTSGNAGIAAAAYCRKAGIKIYIFISPETEKAKIAEMQKYNPIIIKSKRAIRLANYLSAKYKIKNLRPSADDDSIEGFKSIAFEIFEELGEIGALFTFATSGSSFAGIGRAYKYLLENKEIKKIPKLFAVQGGDVRSIAKEFSSSPVPFGYRSGQALSRGERDALIQPSAMINFQAGKLGVKNTRRKREILDLIKSSGGSGVYVNNKEIESARDILNQNKIHTSAEGRASFAGVLRINQENKFDKVVCILSGKERSKVDEIDENRIHKAESFEEVDEIVSSI